MKANKKIKKVIIFFSGYLKEREGGPSSYLYNLRQGLKESIPQNKNELFLTAEGNFQIKFLSQGVLSDNKNKSKKSLFKKPKDAVKRLINKSVFLSRTCFYVIQKIRYRRFKKNKSEIKNADIIHFHRILDYPFLKKIVSEKTIKVLTVHTPESIVDEIPADDFKNNLKNELQKMEREAIEWADVLLYPAPESLENHLIVFPYLADTIKKNSIVYCPTGTDGLTIVKNRKIIRKGFDIPDNAFVVSYVGRHIGVKGFDLLAESLIKILKAKKEIFFLTSGRGELVRHFEEDKLLSKFWRHVEWTDAPGDIINASDCFVLPNRKSFFDLVLIEAMSIGVPIITTDVGGSIFIANKSGGMILSKPKVENIVREIVTVKEMSSQERFRLGRINRASFCKYFNLKVFAESYIKAVQSIILLRKEKKCVE